MICSGRKNLTVAMEQTEFDPSASTRSGPGQHQDNQNSWDSNSRCRSLQDQPFIIYINHEQSPNIKSISVKGSQSNQKSIEFLHPSLYRSTRFVVSRFFSFGK